MTQLGTLVGAAVSVVSASIHISYFISALSGAADENGCKIGSPSQMFHPQEIMIHKPTYMKTQVQIHMVACSLNTLLV